MRYDILRRATVAAVSFSLALAPAAAFASTGAEPQGALEATTAALFQETVTPELDLQPAAATGAEPTDDEPVEGESASGDSADTIREVLDAQAAAEEQARQYAQKAAEKSAKQLRAEKKTRAKNQTQIKTRLEERANKTLSYSKKLIAKIGTQEQTGHTICCPSFSCAYGDAVLDGTYHDHSYYTCSCCTWPDWGGGNSSFRCVGTSTELLREAYDQISEGKPTVIHVSASTGEHWVCLIGYKNVEDPDNLTLSNFVALDPWDGAKITASDRYVLYGDGCEHISSR